MNLSCRNGDRDVKTLAQKQKTGKMRVDMKKNNNNKKKALSVLGVEQSQPAHSTFSTFSINSDHSSIHYTPFNEIEVGVCVWS